MSSPTLRRTPLADWHTEHGARMVEFGGWEMPLHYEDGILQEHLTVRRYGGLFDVSHMGRFTVQGEGAVSFLQHVLTNNAETLQAWGPHAQYTLLADEAGGVMDDAYLYRLGEDDYLLVVNASNREADWEHLTREAAAFDALELVDVTDEMGMVAVQGPAGKTVLESLISAGALSDPIRNRLSIVEIDGVEVVVARTGYTGEPVCFELFVAVDRLVGLWEALLARGRAEEMAPIGLGARDTLRLEAALPLHGHEFGLDPDGEPLPAYSSSLAPIAVSFSPRKGEFIGREGLAAQLERAQQFLLGRGEPDEVLSRQVRTLGLTGRGVARRGDRVYVGEREVGVVTSGTMAPYWVFEGEGATMAMADESVRRSIALAYVDATLPPEQDVDVVIRGKRVEGRIVRWHGRSEAPPYFRAIPAEFDKPAPDATEGSLSERAERVVRRAIDNHRWRTRECINLIPSEMTASPLVRMLQVTDPSGRYAEHKELVAAFEQEVYYYQGTEFIAWVEDRLQAELREYLGCSLVEARPISGQMANMAVFSALVDFRNWIDRRREPGRVPMVMNNHLGKGGHLSAQPMGALRDCVAKAPATERFGVVDFPVRADNPYRIDMAATAELVDRLEPELFVLGKSMVLHPEPVAELRALIEGRSPRPLIMYDMAHVLGLVGPYFQDPFAEGADLVTGSTHKTFFGTQRGIVAADIPENTPDYELWEAVMRRSFPGMTSNHHLGTLLGLLMAAIEMNAFKDEYQPRVVANAKAFAKALSEAGLHVEGDPRVGFTETHQVVVRVGYGLGCEVAERLEASNIIVNYQALPSDEGFTASSGLRMGVAEMTRYGMVEADFARVASLIADVVNGAERAREAAELRSGFQTLRYCLGEGALAPLVEELRGTPL